MKKSELQDLIRQEIQSAVGDQVKQTVEQVARDQVTQHMPNIISQREAPQTREDQKGYGAARFLRALAAGKGDPERAASWAKKAYDDDLGTQVHKSLMAGDAAGAGILIPSDFAPEIIELLRSEAVVRSAGPRVMPMPNGTLTMKKQTSGASASYTGEGQPISTTEPELGSITLTSKKLAAIVPITNDLLMFSAGPQADEFVRDDLVMSLAVREDQAFIRDDGTQDTPKGMRYWAANSNVTASNGTSATNIESDMAELIDDLESNDIRLRRPAWFMTPREKNALRNLRDANGNLIFPEIRNTNPTIYGWPVYTTTNIPTNLGAGGDESEVYFADMTHAVLGESSTLELAVDNSGAYVDGNGNLQSAFANDETMMRAIMRHDFAMRHDVAISVKTGVRWGA